MLEEKLVAGTPPATSAPMSRALVVAGLFVLASLLLMDLAAGRLDAPPVHHLLHQWMSRDAQDDSWGPMIRAYDWLQAPHQTTLYQDVFFTQHVKFQYPPTSLLPLAAMHALGVEPTVPGLNLANFLIFALLALANAVFAVVLARRARQIPREALLPSLVVAGVAGVATAAFYPVIWSYVLGQAQTAIDLAFTLACLCWVSGRRAAAGVLIGAICLLKPQFGLFLIWGAFRRQWPFLIGWGAVVLPGLALSVALFGLANHLDYLATLQFLSSHGEVFYPNQSVNGLLNRLLQNGDSVNWSGTSFPPYRPLVYFGTLLSSAALILAAFFLRGRQADRGGLLDFMTAALTFTIASPIAWEHHYGILPAIFLALLFALLSARPSAGRGGFWAALTASYVLSANFFPLANEAATTPFNFVQSYLLLGGLVALWLLYRVPAPAP